MLTSTDVSATVMPIAVTQQASPTDASASESFTEGLHEFSVYAWESQNGGMLNINPLNLTWSNFSL